MVDLTPAARPYRAALSPEALARLRRLSPIPKRRVNALLREIRRDPRGEGSLQLRGKGNERRYRMRTNSLRIVYTIDDETRSVYVERIRSRPTAYDGLEPPPRA